MKMLDGIFQQRISFDRRENFSRFTSMALFPDLIYLRNTHHTCRQNDEACHFPFHFLLLCNLLLLFPLPRSAEHCHINTSSYAFFHQLNQVGGEELTKFFCKGSDGKYFWICRLHSILSTLYFCHRRAKATTDNRLACVTMYFLIFPTI